jgi:hypothetical protein
MIQSKVPKPRINPTMKETYSTLSALWAIREKQDTILVGISRYMSETPRVVAAVTIEVTKKEANVEVRLPRTEGTLFGLVPTRPDPFGLVPPRPDPSKTNWSNSNARFGMALIPTKSRKFRR